MARAICRSAELRFGAEPRLEGDRLKPVIKLEVTSSLLAVHHRNAAKQHYQAAQQNSDCQSTHDPIHPACGFHRFIYRFIYQLFTKSLSAQYL